jgi:hypothetical protein
VVAVFPLHDETALELRLLASPAEAKVAARVPAKKREDLILIDWIEVLGRKQVRDRGV